MGSTERQLQSVGNAFLRGQRVVLTTLLNDIELHDYTTISEIKGAIYAELDAITKVEKDNE